MRHSRKTLASLLLLLPLAFSAATAGEGSPSPENPAAATDKKSSKGLRHLYINKPAIAERARARQQSLPKQLQPNVGRGFLLEKVQGGTARGELDLAELRRRQLNQVERRPSRSYMVAKAPGPEVLPGTRELDQQAPEAGAGFGTVLGVCAAFGLLFLGLRWRRGRKGS